jgi:hypothetical protein
VHASSRVARPPADDRSHARCRDAIALAHRVAVLEMDAVQLGTWSERRHPASHFARGAGCDPNQTAPRSASFGKIFRARANDQAAKSTPTSAAEPATRLKPPDSRKDMGVEPWRSAHATCREQAAAGPLRVCRRKRECRHVEESADVRAVLYRSRARAGLQRG